MRLHQDIKDIQEWYSAATESAHSAEVLNLIGKAYVRQLEFVLERHLKEDWKRGIEAIHRLEDLEE